MKSDKSKVGDEAVASSSPSFSLRENSVYDVAIIGGGPAGMIAAGRAGELGARVILVEKNKNLGRKLLITGKGRCNITNKTDKPREFINKFGKNGEFLFSAFSRFGTEETINFFENLGVETKIERGGRVFPISDKSQDIVNALINYLRKSNVKIKLNSEVKEIVKENNRIEKVVLANLKEHSFAEPEARREKKLVSSSFSTLRCARVNEEITADKFIVCTGGKSYPKTGSTGQGYLWAQKMGHKIIKPTPSLVPIETKENWVGSLQGVSLKNVSVALFQNNKELDFRFGEMLFTHFGLSGPIILDLSKKIGELLATGEVVLKIDFKPALDFLKLDKRLQRDFKRNKDFKNYLPELLPRKLGDLIVRFSKISPDKKLNSITREERKKLIDVLKGLKLTVKGLIGFSQAIVTSGGVDLKEIDSKTMRSKIIKNLYFAGEILDIDGPTGGYNLQVCWTTGYVAGEGVV